MSDPLSADVIVIGLGAIGAATLYQLAQRGVKAVGFEMSTVANHQGASYGPSKIFRIPYHENSAYLPLAIRALELWRKLESENGETLLVRTGSINAGAKHGEWLGATVAACNTFGVPFELLDAREVNSRYPGYNFPDETAALFQEDGGMLRADVCVSSMVASAAKLGAKVYLGEPVTSWDTSRAGVSVVTSARKARASHLILAPGHSIVKFLPQISHLFSMERQVVVWFEPNRRDWFEPDVFPVFNASLHGIQYSGCPSFGIPGFKFTRVHHLNEIDTTGERKKTYSNEDVRIVREAATEYFPNGAGTTISVDVCWFDNTPDRHFIIDNVSNIENLTIAAGFSGHGFKFAPAIGELLVDLALDKTPRREANLFKLHRFGPIT
jgi:sarcosine oxidase